MRMLPIIISLVLCASAAWSAPRARDLGVPFNGIPGQHNAITDVGGLTVGHTTLIEDLPDGRKIRTGVTAILPRGNETIMKPVYAGTFVLNGAGELTGITFLEHSGRLEGPVMLTNTHSVGTVFETVIAWRIAQGDPDARGYYWSDPVVGEVWDGDLNDVNGFHVRPEHVVHALESASGGAQAEGNVGAGTGTTCHEFKCGIGTSSRVVKVLDKTYTVGALVQANYGIQSTLTIAGVPFGKGLPGNNSDNEDEKLRPEQGSIIGVIATDAPLLPGQLNHLATRAAMGLARVGSYAGNGSGDMFVAFSTANPDAGYVSDRLIELTVLPHDPMDPLLLAAVRSTEEAIVNSIVAARDMSGHNMDVKALRHDVLRERLQQFGRLVE